MTNRARSFTRKVGVQLVVAVGAGLLAAALAPAVSEPAADVTASTAAAPASAERLVMYTRPPPAASAVAVARPAAQNCYGR